MALSNNKPLTYRPQSRPTDRLLILKKKDVFRYGNEAVKRPHYFRLYIFCSDEHSVFFTSYKTIKSTRMLNLHWNNNNRHYQ